MTEAEKKEEVRRILEKELSDYVESLATFQKKVEESPREAMRWMGASIVILQYNSSLATDILRWMDDPMWAGKKVMLTAENLLRYINAVEKNETQKQMNFCANPSTSIFANACDQAEAEARVRLLGGLSGLIEKLNCTLKETK